MSSPRLRHYDRAIWLDADVLICPDALDPVQADIPGQVSMVRDVGSPLLTNLIGLKLNGAVYFVVPCNAIMVLQSILLSFPIQAILVITCCGF